MRNPKRLIAWVLVGCALAVAVYGLAYRPWALTWGATAEEITAGLPGDDIVPAPNFEATRAITIDAHPEEVWPWIVQIGYLKAGFYSYDRLDNDNVPSAERIIPEYQQLSVGDRIPISKTESISVLALEPNRSLVTVFETPTPASWVWHLESVGPARTRLITRLRVRFSGVGPRLFFDAFEIVMMRKHMLGIKRRAEA